MRWPSVFGCLSLIGVIISLLYFNIIGLTSVLVVNEECPQLSDELDLSPVFETNERLFTIDNDKIRQTNEVVFDNFVLKYSNYPETLINQLIMRNNLVDKSGSNQQVRHIPDTVRKYNNTVLNLCRTNSATIQPQSGNSADGRWVVVINQKNFVQNVPVEQCVDRVNMRSNLQTTLLQETDNLICQQTYSLIDLMVVVHDQIMHFKFEYPSACEPFSN